MKLKQEATDAERQSAAKKDEEAVQMALNEQEAYEARLLHEKAHPST